METIIIKILAYVVLLFAITIHEASHGWAAYKFGDATAFHMGRVTLNPIPHIDPVGTVILPLFMAFTGIPLIGWAKPVPVNPMNLKNPRRDNLWISFAGPLSNMAAATGFLILIRIIRLLSPEGFRQAMYVSPGFSGGFQPLQGLFLVLYYAVLINVILAIFNLIPIPPLDGSGILMGFLSPEAADKYEQIRPYGFIIILALVFLGFFRIIFGPIQSIINFFIFG
jgi:Zn-dependent protease